MGPGRAAAEAPAPDLRTARCARAPEGGILTAGSPMGIIFHNGTQQVFRPYTQGRAWDNAALLGVVPYAFSRFNTEDAIRAALQDINNTLVTGIVQNFSGLLQDANSNLWVVKGLHAAAPRTRGGDQGGRQMTHLTAGYDGYLYHFYYGTDYQGDLLYLGYSQGDRYGADGDGFTVVRGRRR